MERQGVSSRFGVWDSSRLYVFVRLDDGRNGERRVMDAEILGILWLLGSFSTFDLVLYE